MKKKTFFLSSLVTVALFVAAMSFASCNKEDVDYDTMDSDYVVNYTTKSGTDSHKCAWCDHIVAIGEVHYHVYGPAAAAAGTGSLWCDDQWCPHSPNYYIVAERPTVPRNHRHVYHVDNLSFGGGYHYGGEEGHLSF